MLRLHAPSLRLSQTLLRGPALRYPALTDLRAALINALFGSGEQGALYPAGPEYWYQDRAGSTPVTAPDQTIGLSLDVSRGLELGPQLNSNPGPGFVVTTGYSSSSAAAELSIVDGRLRLTALDTNANRRLQYEMATVAGRAYEVRYSVKGSRSGLGLSVSWTNLYNSPNQAYTTNFQTFTHRVIANSTVSILRFYLSTAAVEIGDFIELESLSIRELPGNHAIAPSDAARPLAKANPWRVDYDGVDDLLRTVFPDLGTDCTVGRVVPGVGASILTGQTINGNFDDSTDHAGLVIVDRALTVGETDMLTQWLDQQAGV